MVLIIMMMTIAETCTMVRDIAFWVSIILYIIYFICLDREKRKRDRQEEEKRRDHDAMQNLKGDEYWKAYAEYKNKYQKQ